VYADDTIYFGEWLDGKSNGLGEMVLPDGSQYKGNWKQGRYNGVG